MKKYRICRDGYINKFGEKKDGDYFVQKHLSTIFGLSYWKSIRHRECCWGDETKEITFFKSIDEAEKFINDVLSKGIKEQTSTLEVIKEITK